MLVQVLNTDVPHYLFLDLNKAECIVDAKEQGHGELFFTAKKAFYLVKDGKATRMISDNALDFIFAHGHGNEPILTYFPDIELA